MALAWLAVRRRSSVDVMIVWVDLAWWVTARLWGLYLVIFCTTIRLPGVNVSCFNDCDST